MSQDLSENLNFVKLFQLFFPVKEIENIVKQINQQTQYIDFSLKSLWKSLTVTEIYHYLECLIYIEVQSLWELKDHWSSLNFSVKSCLSQKHFKQIQRVFTIWDFNTSSQKSEESWWFRLESLATTIHKVCQKYWVSEAHITVNECMMLYFEHTQHTIKTSHKSIKQDYKIWSLENHDYIFNWLWYSKNQDMKDLDSKSRKNTMTDTQALVLSLAKRLLNPAKNYTLYFDNFFSSISLAVELEKLDIEVMSTAQLTTLELSSSLIQLKHDKEILEWEHLRVAIIKRILCFLWQDNNWVLDKIIAYNYYRL